MLFFYGQLFKNGLSAFGLWQQGNKELHKRIHLDFCGLVTLRCVTLNETLSALFHHLQNRGDNACLTSGGQQNP